MLPSTSVPNMVTAKAVSSSVVTVRDMAKGASLTATMLSETVATPESSAPSFTLKVKESGPVALAFGT